MPEKLLKTFLKNPDLASRIILILAVIGVFIIAILLSGPKPVEYSETNGEFTPSVVPTINASASKNTPDDPAVASVTKGVIVGVAAVLVIVELGTLVEMNYQKHHPDL